MSSAQCFYPNGSPSLEDDIPCGSGDAVACCPLNWSCQDNGLCYLQNEDYYGRYTCTDKSWGPGCPDICTYGKSAPGNEAVLECTPGSYCCDTNRPELSGGTNCCDASPTRFSISDDSEVPSDSAPSSTSPQSSTPADPSSAAASTLASASPSSSSIPPPPTSSTTPSSTVQASTTAVAPSASPSLACDDDPGETACGPICCATDQYCAYAGQCAQSTPATGGGTSTPVLGSSSNAATTNSSDLPSSTMKPTSTKQSLRPTVRTSSSSTSSSTSFSVITTTRTASIKPNPTSTSMTPITTSNHAAAQSPSVTSTPGFKAGVTVGSAVALSLLILALFLYHKRSGRPNPTFPISEVRHDTTANSASAATDHFATPVIPDPNPYVVPFPLNQPRANNRSRYNGSIIPDHEREQSRSQPNLRYPPPLNPYNRSQTSSAPTYHTEDPLQGRRRRTPMRAFMRER